jgi:hypothetical protein
LRDVERLPLAIRIENTTTGAGPVIICDYCGERITDARDGNYEWADVTGAPGQRMAVYFLHKRCSAAHEALHGIVLDSMELTVLLPYLAHNLHLDWDEATHHAETLSAL